MSDIKNKIVSFLEGKYYPALLLVVTLIAHTFSIELFAVAVFFLTAGFGLILCKDLKFFISPFLMFIFIFSEKSVASGMYYETPYLIAMVCCAVLLIGLFVAHFIIHKEHVSFKSFLKSKLFWGYALLSASFLLNGALNFDEYTLGNIVYALILIASITLIFVIFYANLSVDRTVKEHTLYVLYLLSWLVTLEMLIFLFTDAVYVNGSIVKEYIKLGWGLWNNIGGMLILLLPIHFYYACTKKRFSYLYYLGALIPFLAIVMTLSRSSLLVGAFMMAVCALICCFKGQNKRSNLIITGALLLAAIVGVIVLWDKISTVLLDYLNRGLDDNGRFEMYLHGLENYSKNPLFGGGFYSSYELETQFIIFLPFRYHNTIIQMMGTCGIVGLASYLWHRYETFKLFSEKRSLVNLFIGLCIISMLLGSLLDNHIFNIYPAFVYSLLLVVVEKSKE